MRLPCWISLALAMFSVGGCRKNPPEVDRLAADHLTALRALLPELRTRCAALRRPTDAPFAGLALANEPLVLEAKVLCPTGSGGTPFPVAFTLHGTPSRDATWTPHPVGRSVRKQTPYPEQVNVPSSLVPTAGAMDLCVSDGAHDSPAYLELCVAYGAR